jgi:cell division protein FtsN
VALYITKAPIQFTSKGQTRSAEQDVLEAKKNRDWDPNAPLYGKKPAPAVVQPEVPGAPAANEPAVAAPSTAPAAAPAAAPVDAAKESKTAKTDVKAESAAKADDPLAARVKEKTAANEPQYFVQVGSFSTPEAAAEQRAKLSLGGVESQVSELKLAEKTVYRVRVGPFDKKDEAEKSKSKLDALDVKTSLVSSPRANP